MSPILFNLYINDLIKDINERNNDHVILSSNIKISSLSYADDLILISTSKTGLQQSLDIIGKYSKDWRLDINYKRQNV